MPFHLLDTGSVPDEMAPCQRTVPVHSVVHHVTIEHGDHLDAAPPRACPQCRLVVTPFVVRRHELTDQAWEVIGPL
uniref:hypothetical protein n=1 Tax=Streptomyces sp. NRRL F-2747 TaxID=1463843 RepID=UPI001F2B6081